MDDARLREQQRDPAQHQEIVRHLVHHTHSAFAAAGKSCEVSFRLAADCFLRKIAKAAEKALRAPWLWNSFAKRALDVGKLANPSNIGVAGQDLLQECRA